MKRKPNAKRREANRRAQLRELRVKSREVRTETLYVRTYVRRPFWQRANTTAWLLIIGILVGGGLIPHVEDRPYLAEPETEAAAPPRPPRPPAAVGLMDKDGEPEPTPPMTYSWAPSGTEGYRIAFYRDGNIIYTTTTDEPTLTYQFPPGEYQWVVWAAGKSKAIVNSSVTIT